MWEQLKELRYERGELFNLAREIVDQAENENRDLTEEEEKRYQKINVDIDEKARRIERLEQHLQMEQNLQKAQNQPVKPDPEHDPISERADKRNAVKYRNGTRMVENAENQYRTTEYTEAFWKYFRSSMSGLLPNEIRALNIGTDTEGGFLVPDEFHDELIASLTEQNVMRQLGRVISTGSGDRNIPIVTDHGAAQWIGEAAVYPEDQSTFTRQVLSAHKLARITRVTEELLNDSQFDIESHVSDAFVRAFGDAEEAAFVNGTGVGQPTGVLQTAQLGVTTAVNNAVTGDELINMFHSLRPPYRTRAVWLFHDSTAAAIRKIKDSTNQYLWQPGLQAGQPDLLLGRPVRISRFVPEIAPTTTIGAFGDFSFYLIADRDTIGMQRLVELYAANGEVGFRMFMRVDGLLILPEAVKTLETPI